MHSTYNECERAMCKKAKNPFPNLDDYYFARGVESLTHTRSETMK